MANTDILLIEKNGSNNFWHTHNGLALSKYFISGGYRFSIDGNLFKVTENDGASRYRYLVSNITIKDNTDTGANETGFTPTTLRNRLVALGYAQLFVPATGLTSDEVDAINSASSPSASNPFVTQADLISGIATPYATFQFLRKGWGNSGAIGQAGDVYQGWVSDGVYCPFAVYDGIGDLNNPASFNIVSTIEI